MSTAPRVSLLKLTKATRDLRIAAERVGIYAPVPNADWRIVIQDDPLLYTLLWIGPEGYQEPCFLFPVGILGPNSTEALATLSRVTQTLRQVPIDGKDADGNRVGPQPATNGLTLSFEVTTLRPVKWTVDDLLRLVDEQVNAISPTLKFRTRLVDCTTPASARRRTG